MSDIYSQAVHLGPHYTEYLRVNRNTNFEELQNLFDITQRLILDHQTEILNVLPIDGTAPSWTRSTLTHDQAITWTKAKVRVYSDSVPCLEICQSILKRIKDEKIKLKNFDRPIVTEKYLELMENRLSLSGIFSQDVRPWRSF